MPPKGADSEQTGAAAVRGVLHHRSAISQGGPHKKQSHSHKKGALTRSFIYRCRLHRWCSGGRLAPARFTLLRPSQWPQSLPWPQSSRCQSCRPSHQQRLSRCLFVAQQNTPGDWDHLATIKAIHRSHKISLLLCARHLSCAAHAQHD